MFHIRAGQIKAARALLDWSQGDLAEATGLSINTIRNLESGDMSARNATAHIVCQTMEKAGIEFTEHEGVKRRNDEITIYQGLDSCEVFFDDVMQTIKKRSDGLAIMIGSQDMLARSFGVTDSGKNKKLEELGNVAGVKCLLSEIPHPAVIVPSVQFRTISKQNICPLSCFIYGDKYALALLEGAAAPRFVVFKSVGTTQSYRSRFLFLWDNAAPFLIQPEAKERRARV